MRLSRPEEKLPGTQELGGQRNPGVTWQVELPLQNSPRRGMEKPLGSLCMTLKIVLALSRPHLLPSRMRAWTLRSHTITLQSCEKTSMNTSL